MITFKYAEYGVEIEYKTKRITCSEIVEDFSNFLLAVGFAPETVKQSLEDV